MTRSPGISNGVLKATYSRLATVGLTIASISNGVLKEQKRGHKRRHKATPHLQWSIESSGAVLMICPPRLTTRISNGVLKEIRAVAFLDDGTAASPMEY